MVSDAHERQSVVLTTDPGLSRRGAVLGDAQVATAIIDHIVHHGRPLRFEGEPCRVGHALMGGAQNSARMPCDKRPETDAISTHVLLTKHMSDALLAACPSVRFSGRLSQQYLVPLSRRPFSSEDLASRHLAPSVALAKSYITWKRSMVWAELGIEEATPGE